MSRRMRLLCDTVLGVGMAALFISTSHAMSCDNIDGRAVEMRWAKSSNRIYLSSGCATIADVLAFRSDSNGAKGPIFHFNQETNTLSPTYTGVYYLEASLFVTNNATLSINGNNSDFQPCKTLLLASNSSTYQNIRAHGGNLKIVNTKIFSWDLDAGYYDLIHGDGRSFLSAITEKITGRPKDTCPGLPESEEVSNGRAKLNMGNARMDIINSEIGYLGFNNSESYGVSFKARGLCKDVSNSDIFDDDNGFDVAVRGDILNSKIHHCWFGHYSFGHQDGRWNHNEVHDNYGYGFDPHDDSDKIEIIGNTVYNNGWHGIIASKRCTDLLLKDNVVFNNGLHGIMLHRSCDRTNITENDVFENGQSGIAIFETWDTLITNNTLTGNKYGLRLSNGAVNNVVTHNKINVVDSSNVYAVFMYKGSDPPEVSNGRPSNNRIRNNEIHTTQEIIFKISNGDGNIITDNVVVGGSRAIFNDATDTLIRSNTFSSPVTYDAEDSCFREGSVTGPACD